MKISIIVPNYNNSKYLSRAIDSILMQEYSNYEIIIVDGYSTDNSISIINKYLKEHHNINAIIESDLGQSHAINKGILHSTGEVVTWLNSDDEFLPMAFNEVIQQLSNNNSIVFGNCTRINEESKIIGNEISQYNGWRYLLLYGNTLPQMTVFWKKTLVEKYGLLEIKYKYAMDYDYWLRLLRNENIVKTEQILSSFRIHSGSISKNSEGLFNYQSFSEVMQIRIKYCWAIIILYPFYLGIEIYRKIKKYVNA